MIDGIEVAVDREAVVVTAREPLTILSSAFVGGGFTTARAIVNLHVRKNIPEAETDGLLPRFVERREIRGPWIGLLTSAWTEKAVVAEASGSGIDRPRGRDGRSVEPNRGGPDARRRVGTDDDQLDRRRGRRSRGRGARQRGDDGHRGQGIAARVRRTFGATTAAWRAARRPTRSSSRPPDAGHGAGSADRSATSAGWSHARPTTRCRSGSSAGWKSIGDGAPAGGDLARLDRGARRRGRSALCPHLRRIAPECPLRRPGVARRACSSSRRGGICRGRRWRGEASLDRVGSPGWARWRPVRAGTVARPRSGRVVARHAFRAARAGARARARRGAAGESGGASTRARGRHRARA